MRRTIVPSLLFALGLLAWSGEASAFCGFYVGKADTRLFNKASEVAIARHDNLLRALATQRIHVGAAGMGTRAKLATNLVLGLNRAALAVLAKAGQVARRRAPPEGELHLCGRN